MSGFEPLLPLAWGALRLTSSLVTAGFKKLVGVEDDSGLLTWSGDVVVKARHTSGSGPVTSQAFQQHRDETRRDLAGVRARVEECHAENMQFFEMFMGNIEATQQGIDVLRNGPLEEAEMSLKEFQASGGDLDELKEASRKARTALVTGKTLDIKISAATIAISAGYVYKSKTDSPTAAKQSTVKGTLANIVKHFAPIWADPSCASTEDGRKVLLFLGNLVSCVSVLPPESVPVFPELDRRLFSALSQLCLAQPELRCLLPGIATVAVTVVLEEKTLTHLVLLAGEMDVDIDQCTSKEEVVEALLASGKSLLGPSPAAGGGDGSGHVLEDQSMLDLCMLAQEKDIDMSPLKGQAIRILLASGKELEPTRNATTDFAAVMVLFGADNDTEGGGKGWGRLVKAEDCMESTDDHDGGGRRVAKLLLMEKGLKGPIQSVIGNFTVLVVLNLHGNELSGSIPAALGNLTSLLELDLHDNQLSGSIPAALGRLKSLTHMALNGNRLSGPIPAQLGRLTALEFLLLQRNQLSGPIPAALGGLTTLEVLCLNKNQLSGSIPAALGGLKSLKILCLQFNNLSGPIPVSLSGLTALEGLILHKNQLSGPIPPSLGRLSALKTLGLHYNQLTGSVPDELEGLKSLNAARIDGNQLNTKHQDRAKDIAMFDEMDARSF